MQTAKVELLAISKSCPGVVALDAYAFYTGSGYPLAAVGVEFDAIAAVALGGTLLTGGVGYVAGTLFGGLIQGTIRTLIVFDGRLTSWWTKIVIGALLFFFITAHAFDHAIDREMRRPA